jgi:PAS domain S-box-containing protein
MSVAEPTKLHEDSEARFRLVAENAPVMLWMGDVAGACVYLNRLQREFWGVEGEDLSGFDWSTTLLPEDFSRLATPFAEAMQAHAGFTIEARYRRADGVYRTLQTNARPRFSAKGDFLGMIGVNVDVTEQRAAEEQLRALNETLEGRVAEEIAVRQKAEVALQQAQKMEAIGQLTGGVAHDFNNLLMAVIGSLELLRKKMPADPQLLRLLDNAMEGAQRGSALTSRMLTFARRQELRRSAVDIPALFAGMEELLKRSLGPMIAIETRFPQGLAAIETDPGQLETALINICVNARDAMHEQGTITIEASEETVRRECGLADGRYVRLAVRDTGDGMDADTLRRASEPFFTTKEIGKGTGLGLSMVHGLAEQSGGRLVLKSAPGEGTTAEIWLPTAAHPPLEAADAGEGITEAIEPAEARSLTVLAVDDDALVRMNTVSMLEDLGHTVIEARSGREALEKLAGRQIDLVITDHAMPQMSGVQLAEALRATHPDLPIVLATGYAELPDGDDPGLPRLPKPFSMDDLERLLRWAAGRR